MKTQIMGCSIFDLMLQTSVAKENSVSLTNDPCQAFHCSDGKAHSVHAQYTPYIRSIYILLVKAVKLRIEIMLTFFINLDASVITHIDSYVNGYIIDYKYATD